MKYSFNFSYWGDYLVNPLKCAHRSNRNVTCATYWMWVTSKVSTFKCLEPESVHIEANKVVDEEKHAV